VFHGRRIKSMGYSNQQCAECSVLTLFLLKEKTVNVIRQKLFLFFDLLQ